MKFANWFRIGWWFALTIAAAFFLTSRYATFVIGKATPVDAFVFLIWVALLLVPIFSEVSLNLRESAQPRRRYCAQWWQQG